jgi:signal transduction histidine kinase
VRSVLAVLAVLVMIAAAPPRPAASRERVDVVEDTRFPGEDYRRLGREILLGAPTTPPPREADSVLLFDWRELRRWGLHEADLPGGSQVLFRGQTFWEAHGDAFIVTTVSLLEAVLIAVLLWQWRRRRRAERSLTERLRFEEIVAQLNGRFVGLTAADVHAESVRSLGEVGEFLGVDRATLVAPDERSGVFRVRGWARAGVKPGPAVISLRQFPWTAACMRRGEIVRFTRLKDLPAAAAVDRRTYDTIGARSLIGIPLVADEVMVGSVSFSTVRDERAWPDELVQRLQLLAEVFANVLARRRADEALRQSRALSVAIVDSLPGKVMVLDRTGVIIATSDGAAGDASMSHLSTGVDYLERWRRCALGGDRAAAEILRGVVAVLDGTAAQFVSEYHRRSGGEARWLEFRVHPLRSEAGGAVISRIDVSDRKQAELETRRVRDELARVGRLVTVGQLTAALAHEVKQPLTGILTNAQVARRLVAAGRPDLVELRAILDDIVRDDQRAADVIQRLRAMLKRHEPELVSLDVNRLIRDVVRFLHSDAVLRSASIGLDLAPGLPLLRGDVVQLQQVLVNLVLNGLDAMRSVPAERRRLVIRTDRVREGVRVGVRDCGTGLDASSRERIFEPFYTTKAEGMGLGLPIARTIVEAAGGRLWAADNEDAGATFIFTLPLPDDGAPDLFAAPSRASVPANW